MKINLIKEPQIIMSNPHSKHNYFGWPSAVRLQNGKIAAVASGYRLEHVCPFGKAVISYSEDEGETYTAPAPVIDTVLDDRDAGICTFGKKGVIVTSFNNTREMQKSCLGKCDRYRETATPYSGAYLDFVSDEEEKEFLGSVFRISNDCGVTFGEIHKAPITSPHGPVELNDGTVLWVGRTFSEDDTMMGYDRICAYKINTDNGETELVGIINPIFREGKQAFSCEPYAIQLDDGTIICHIRVQNPGFTIYQSVSKDMGKTWSEPVQILADNGGAPSHILKHSSGVLIATYSYREFPYGIKAMLSYDNGNTWDTDHIVYPNEIDNDIGYPMTVELNDGSLITVFYARPYKGSPAVIMQQKWSFEKPLI